MRHLLDYISMKIIIIGLAQLKMGQRLSTKLRDLRIAPEEMEYRHAEAYLNSEWYNKLLISDQSAVRKLVRLTDKRDRPLNK